MNGSEKYWASATMRFRYHGSGLQIKVSGCCDPIMHTRTGLSEESLKFGACAPADKRKGGRCYHFDCRSICIPMNVQ